MTGQRDLLPSSVKKRRSVDQHSSKGDPRKFLIVLIMACSVVYIAGIVKGRQHLIQIHSDRISHERKSEFAPRSMESKVGDRITDDGIMKESELDGNPKSGEHVDRNNNQNLQQQADGSVRHEPSGRNTTTLMANTKPEIPGDESEDYLSTDEENEEGYNPTLHINSTLMISGAVQNHRLVPFVKQDGVVIVTKIHGPHQLRLLEQSLCLLHYAYNRRPLYDVLVFTTLPVSDAEAQPLQTMVQPAKLSFVVDNRGIQEEITALSPERRANFLKSCNVTDPSNVTWWSDCPNRIAYNWQAEFRSWHIWRHEALRPYRWMMWLDADGFCTEEWKVDPIQVMIENDLVILFDNWPKGTHKGKDVQDRIYEAFGVNICSLRMTNRGIQPYLSNSSDGCSPGRVAVIHGFFHITVRDKKLVYQFEQSDKCVLSVHVY